MDTEIIVAIVGTLGSAAIGASAYLYKSRQEIKAIRRAFLSEIGSIAEMIRLRRYVEDLLECACQLDQEGNSGQMIAMQVPLDLNTYRPIWNHYASRIGSMSDKDSAQILRFYQLIDGAARDVCPGGVLYGGSFDSRPFKESAEVLQKALSIADQLTGAK